VADIEYFYSFFLFFGAIAIILFEQ